nr:EOG090X0H59 [Eulimnadia texana]
MSRSEGASSSANVAFDSGDYESNYGDDDEAVERKRKRMDLATVPKTKTSGLASKSIFASEASKEEGRRLRSHLLSLNAYDRHKMLVNEYLLCYPGATKTLQRDHSRDKRDIDVIKENHRFLWDEEDVVDTWGKQLAKKYYDKLFKEYCICDLSRYKENKVAMRWRIEKEVVDGKGQFFCGERKCQEKEGLRTWEVNFAYMEDGQKKNALVKLRLCPDCSYKLNYHHKKREVTRGKNKKKRKKEKKQKKRKKGKESRKESDESEESAGDQEDKNEEEKSTEEAKTAAEAEDIWRQPTQTQLFVLFEHAAGYGLFRVKEFEDVGTFLPQVEQSVTDLSRFNQVVKLEAFAPFKSAAHALDNINAVSEGILTEDLQLLLENSFPKTKSGKKKKEDGPVLGVSEPKLGAAITEALSIACQHTGPVPEITRGIRYHFASLVKGFTPQSSGKAQLGLGHSYSRAKVKFNVHRVDNMIIQSIALLDQLDKDINTFSMRIREWYSYHFPELVKIVPDNYLYARTAQYIKNRKELSEESLPHLEEIVMDSAKAQTILDAARSSMGMDISPIDLMNIERFAGRVVALAEYRKELQEYLKSKMHNIAPNLSALIGEQVGARLIAHAGSLTNLAKYPASTVQILGAEKALFRALKTRGNTPKYGLIFHSTFIGRAAAKNKGRISRYLANKCSIASRIDCFSEMQCDVFGQKLREQVEERLKFYDTGDVPRKNVDVMQEALSEAVEAAAASAKKKKKKDKKKKKAEDGDEDAEEQPEAAQESPEKKKKKRKSENGAAEAEEAAEETGEKKKKKKKHAEVEETAATEEAEAEEEASPSKKAKKKKKKNASE